jgi:hypothetical protein
MSMADKETFEWTKDLLLFDDLARAVRKGGLTADERANLSQKFGVSEDLLLRYERAKAAWNTLIFDKQWVQARMEAVRLMNKLGKDLLSPELGEETSKAFHRILDALPEPEKAITRERDEAVAAIRAALDASTSTPEK